MQIFAAIVISGRWKYDHISDVIKDLEWLYIGPLVDMNDMCLLHNIIVTGEPEVLRKDVCYNREVSQRRTRQSDHLYVPRTRTNLGQRAFMYRTCKLYNENVIGTELQNMSQASFKKALKSRLLN